MSRQVKTALSVAVVLIAIIFGLSATGTLDGLLRTLDVAATGETSVEQTPPTSAGGTAGEPSTGVDSAEVAEQVVPIFDLIRVEPDGAAVMAGQGAPNATVEILSNNDVVASGKATAEGSWAIVLEDPLAAGAHDIRVRATSPDGGPVIESEQRVAVSVPTGGQGEVLVVLNQPGTASAVLQLPGGEGSAITALTPPASTDPQSSGAAASTGASVATTVDTPPAEDVAPPATAQPADPAPAAPSVATADAAADTAADASTSAETAAAPESAPQPSASTETATTDTPPAATTTTTTTASQDAPAAGAADAAASATASAEGNAAEVAKSDAGAAEGAAAPGVDTPAASTTTDTAANDTAANGAVEPGTTPADAAATTPDPSGAPDNDAGAEQTLAAVQPDSAAEAGEGAPTAGGSAAATIGEAVPGADAPAAPAVTVEAVEIENATMLFAAGAAPRGARVRLYINDQPVGDAIAGAGDRWLLQQVISPLAPGAYRVRADKLDPAGGVSARAEVQFDFRDVAPPAEAAVAEAPGTASGAATPSQDTVTTVVSGNGITVAGSGTGAAAVGSGDEGEARVGQPASIIIRTGDNLWTISRRLYGRGVRYSTIYLANTDQIRSPHLIYPGQVFVLPAGDASWPADPAPAAAATPAPASDG
ncbi:LysM peptidoglycan-binding domain-containing protein [Methylobrevis albus]|uniref:LysM peptidoglycan-binding domain-containing protein n=1 Tax=Methylobrevis albus TaxID=2793297 RepID=A0A931I3I3_9HYPH|nr:LysM peptidoglycan-binding domain-containing protein [Methylobrevis albus]MBH0239187.1 LysM peptidoglycan-binding domain-containing protein [Methylobrevis albus]